MLYNPKWEVGTIADLIAWIGSKPAAASYFYNDCTGCLLAQYYQDRGYPDIIVGSTSLTHGPSLYLPPHFNNISVWGQRTFGAALERALQVQSSK